MAIGGSIAEKLLREAMEKAVVDAAGAAARKAARKVAKEAAEKAAVDAAQAAGEKAAREAAEKGATAAAQKTAREAAEESQRKLSAEITKRSVNEAGEKAAAKAVKKAVIEASEKAAKEAGDKAAREAAEAGASASAQKAARETAEAASRKAAKGTNYTKFAAYAAGAGVSAYVYTEMLDETEAVQKCTGECLPTNWDAYKYEDLEKSDLEYSLVTPSESQPICTDETEAECDVHCIATCKEIHKTGLLDKLGPVGDVAQDLVDEGTTVFTDGVNTLFETLGLPPLTGPDGLLAKFGKYFKIAGIVCCVLCLIYIIFMFL